MAEFVRLKLVVDTGFSGATHEDYINVDRELWDAMTPQEQDNYGWDAAEGFASGQIETYYEVVEDDEFE